MNDAVAPLPEVSESYSCDCDTGQIAKSGRRAIWPLRLEGVASDPQWWSILRRASSGQLRRFLAHAQDPVKLDMDQRTPPRLSGSHALEPDLNGEQMTRPLEPKERADIRTLLGMDGSAASSWTQRRKLKWAAAVIVGLLLISVVWWFGSAASNLRYITEPVRRGSLIVIVTATGSVQPTEKVDISSELSGTVRRVLVDFNSAVTAGQVIAELDTDKLEATANSSRAKLAAAKTKVAEAAATVIEKEQDLTRQKRLASSNSGVAQDLDRAKAAYDRATASLASARADVDVAEADLRLNEINLAKAYMRSPIDGVVLKRDVDPGQIVASSLQAPVLFSIAKDLKQMELQVDVDEADVGKVPFGLQESDHLAGHPVDPNAALQRYGAARMLRDHDLGAALVEIGDDVVAVEGLIGDQSAELNACDQRRDPHRVKALPRQEDQSDEVAERVGEGQDLGRHAALGLADGLALSPPFAPCPWRWTPAFAGAGF